VSLDVCVYVHAVTECECCSACSHCVCVWMQSLSVSIVVYAVTECECVSLDVFLTVCVCGVDCVCMCVTVCVCGVCD